MKSIATIFVSVVFAFTGLTAQTWNTVYEMEYNNRVILGAYSLGDDLVLTMSKGDHSRYNQVRDTAIIINQDRGSKRISLNGNLKNLYLGRVGTSDGVSQIVSQDNQCVEYRDGSLMVKEIYTDNNLGRLVSCLNTLELFDIETDKPYTRAYEYYDVNTRKITKLNGSMPVEIYNEPINFSGEIKVLNTGNSGYIISTTRHVIHTVNRNIEGYFEEEIFNEFLRIEDIKFDNNNNVLHVVATDVRNAGFCGNSIYLYSVVLFTYDMTENKGRKKEFIVRDQERPGNNSSEFYDISYIHDFEIIEGVQFVNTDEGVFYNTGAGMEKLEIEGEEPVNSIRLIDDKVYAVTDTKVLVNSDLMSSVETVVAVDELKIYPNKIDRSVNTISIDMPTQYGFENLSVYTMNGNKVSEVNDYYELGSKYTLDVPGNLVSGMYFVKMSSDGTEYAAKLIVTD